jgi:putative tricarboxylic transport membrane protein
MELLQIITSVLTPTNLALIFLGTVIGITFGAIPGLNTPIAVALVLPFTFAMDVIPTVCIIMGIYMGGVSGGLVSAILLRIPGTAAAVATTFDGYPLTLKGRSTEALAMGTFASFFGGVFSSVALLTLCPVLSSLAIGFGPWEYFGSVFLGLSLVCILMKGRVVKGFITMFLGLLLKTVGMDPNTGSIIRFNFGYHELDSGFHLIAIIIGVFALPEVLNNAGRLMEKIKPATFKERRFFVPAWKDIKAQLGNMVRSSIIGTIVGILPGLGGGPAALIAYAQARKFSKTPEEFGKGCLDGIAAPESANNATTGGALIPMLSLGVPGDTTTAIIMGALMIQGITTGPLLMLTKPVLFRTIIFAVFVANFFMFAIQASTIKYAAKIVQLPKFLLIPMISVFCVTGVISLNNRTFDLIYMLLFIILGYVLEKNGRNPCCSTVS